MWPIILEIDKLDATPVHENYGNEFWSTALHVLLPLAALTLLWGRHGFITTFFLQFKDNCVSALCPSLDKHQKLLKLIEINTKNFWIAKSAPLDSNIAKNYWKNGSHLCSLINSAIPGACSNPQRHWNSPPTHGQSLAFKYLGITPIFKETDFKDEQLLGKTEYQFFNYLADVQKSVEKVLKREVKFSSRYAARGMGLVTGERYKNSTFYIYNNSSGVKHIDVVISIRGPYGTHCSSTIALMPAKREKSVTYVSRAQKLLFRSLSIDLGSSKKIDEKEAPTDNIPISITPEKDRVKVVFVPQAVGMHEISIVTKGFHLVGSPFLANVLPLVHNEEKWSNEQINTEKCSNNYKRIKKKILSQIIDCIDEQINLYSIPGHKMNMEFDEVLKTQDNPEKINYSNDANNSPTHDATTKTCFIEMDDVGDNCQNLTISMFGESKSDATCTGTSCLQKHQKLDNVVDDSKTSPICENHIYQEVDTELKPSLGIDHTTDKKHLTRQYRFNTDDEKDITCTPIKELPDKNLDITFKNLSKSKEQIENNSIYCDSYLSMLEFQPEILEETSSTFLKRGNFVEEYLKRPIPKTRKSLPNILMASNCFPVSSATHETKFKERQKYWEKCNSQTFNSLGVDSDNYTTNFYLQKNDNTVKSLPNLCDFNEVANENNIESGYLDFYNDYNAESFRDQFMKYRNFWETLSSQNISVFNERGFDCDNDYDSGYYASLPNLIPDTNGTRLSKKYKEKRQFWENLSLDRSKWVTHQQQKDRPKFLDKRKLNFGEEKSNNRICEYEEEMILGDEKLNLTDDLKELGHIQYHEARDYFKSLEKIRH